MAYRKVQKPKEKECRNHKFLLQGPLTVSQDKYKLKTCLTKDKYKLKTCITKEIYKLKTYVLKFLQRIEIKSNDKYINR